MKKQILLFVLMTVAVHVMAIDTIVLRVDDMHCRKCANRIQAVLGEHEGIDSVGVRIGRHIVSVRYDDSVLTGSQVRDIISQAGYTPVVYVPYDDVAYAYYTLPEEGDAAAHIGDVRSIAGVCDVNLNSRRHALAVTYRTSIVDDNQLLRYITAAGIAAVVPPPHVCKEGQPQ